jgi:hypothetical protein
VGGTQVGAATGTAMVAARSFAYVLLAVLAITALVTECEISCEDVDFEVSLSLTNNEDICPFRTYTARCVVKPSTDFLLWECEKNGDPIVHVVLCEDTLDFDCEFGTLHNVTGACDCLSEGKVITSEVTFRTNAVSARDMTLTCGNGRTEQRNLSVSVEGLQTPHLNYTTIAADKDVLNVSVTWTTEDSDKKDIEYVLSVSADSLSQNKSTTTNRKQNLTLFNGTEYTITVISQRCGGDLTSNTSDPKHILFPVITPTVGALDTRSIGTLSTLTSADFYPKCSLPELLSMHTCLCAMY